MGEQGGQPALTAAGHGSAEQDRTRKILVSEALRRSGRLKELLVYLLARTAESPEAPVREQEIGVSVYNRSPGYDTSHDTIVRVQVAQLRKKLERYYQREGASDEVVLTIPRGSYQPVWHPRAEIPVQLSPSFADAPHPKRRLVAALATILFIAIAVTLILRRSPDSTVNRFWSQLLVPGKTTNIVLSDPGIVMLAQAMGRPIRFPELGGRLFLSGIEGLNTSPEYKDLMHRVTSAQLTTLSDVEIVRRITALGLHDPEMFSIVASRDFRIRELNSNNTVLIGYGLSNPWVQVFKDSINFVLDQDPERDGKAVLNLRPQAGEQPLYHIEDPQKTNPAQGYSTVAFLPNPTQSGKVLIISGADVPGTEAAIRFLMTEGMWRPFAQRIARGAQVPPFEVLLAYRRLSNSSGDVSLVAWRVKQ